MASNLCSPPTTTLRTKFQLSRSKGSPKMTLMMVCSDRSSALSVMEKSEPLGNLKFVFPTRYNPINSISALSDKGKSPR